MAANSIVREGVDRVNAKSEFLVEMVVSISMEHEQLVENEDGTLKHVLWYSVKRSNWPKDYRSNDEQFVRVAPSDPLFKSYLKNLALNLIFQKMSIPWWKFILRRRIALSARMKEDWEPREHLITVTTVKV